MHNKIKTFKLENGIYNINKSNVPDNLLVYISDR